MAKATCSVCGKSTGLTIRDSTVYCKDHLPEAVQCTAIIEARRGGQARCRNSVYDGGLFCVQHRDYAKNPVSAEWEVCPVCGIRQRPIGGKCTQCEYRKSMELR